MSNMNKNPIIFPFEEEIEYLQTVINTINRQLKEAEDVITFYADHGVRAKDYLTKYKGPLKELRTPEATK